MSEIPEDIEKAARRLITEGWAAGRAPAEVVARAILAERERCQKIAKRIWRDADFYENAAIRRAVSLIRCRIETGAPQ